MKNIGDPIKLFIKYNEYIFNDGQNCGSTLSKLELFQALASHFHTQEGR